MNLFRAFSSTSLLVCLAVGAVQAQPGPQYPNGRHYRGGVGVIGIDVGGYGYPSQPRFRSRTRAVYGAPGSHIVRQYGYDFDPAVDQPGFVELPQAAYSGANSSTVVPAQPVVNQQKNLIPTNAAAESFQRAAESALRVNDIEYARQSVERAIKSDPNNGLLKLFASHLHFVVGDFAKSVQILDEATRLTPATNWDFIVRNVQWLDGRDKYTVQLNRLGQYLNRNPKDQNARVLYAFHIGNDRQVSVAHDHLAAVLQLDPNNTLATRIMNEVAMKMEGRIDDRGFPIQTSPTSSPSSGRLRSVRIQNRTGTMNIGVGRPDAAADQFGN